MGYTVISSGPSPYARKVRINLIELGIPFTLQDEVPWNDDTQTPNYNPLEKLPVLIIRDDNAAPSAPPQKVVYESAVILDYLNSGALGPSISTSLLPTDPELRWQAKQLEALADGVADAVVLALWETRRDEAMRSKEWLARQRRKIEGGVKALDEAVRAQARNGFLVGGALSIADLAVGSALGFVAFRDPLEWKEKYPELRRYYEGLEGRESFRQTVPAQFQLKDKVV